MHFVRKILLITYLSIGLTFKFSEPKASPQEKSKQAANKRKKRVQSATDSAVQPSKKKKAEQPKTDEKSTKLRESTYKTPANFPKIYLPPPTPSVASPVVRATTPPRRTRTKQRKSVSAPTTPVRRAGRPRKVQ